MGGNVTPFATGGEEDGDGPWEAGRLGLKKSIGCQGKWILKKGQGNRGRTRVE